MSDADTLGDPDARPATGLWPFWRRLYAAGDPLPAMAGTGSPHGHRFDEGDPLPEEYKALLLKMLRHEGERAGNKSFLGFMGTCLELAEALAPTPRRSSSRPSTLRRS